MPSMKVTTVEISTNPPLLADLLALTAKGEEVLIAEHGKPLARLEPVATSPLSDSESALPKRILGLHEGQGWMSDDFNAPLPDEFWGGRI